MVRAKKAKTTRRTRAEGYLQVVWRNGRGFFPAETRAPTLDKHQDNRRKVGKSTRSTTARAWSKRHYRYFRGHTLAGQARPSRSKRLAHENARQADFGDFKIATKASKEVQGKVPGPKLEGTISRGKARNEARTTGKMSRPAMMKVQGLNVIQRKGLRQIL